MKIYFSLLDLLYQGPRSKFLSGGGLFLASLFLLNYFLFNFSKKVGGGGAKAPNPPHPLSLRGPCVLTITRQIINLFPVAVS